jgi:hypothetical protein
MFPPALKKKGADSETLQGLNRLVENEMASQDIF